jgi:hypothetical protein
MSEFKATDELTTALRIHAVDGIAYLDRPAWIRRLVSSTLRGFAGHRLREHAPAICDRLFKPVGEINVPSACLFQNLEQEAYEGEIVRFRIVTWDPGLELIPALQHAMEAGRGQPFGGQGARLHYVEWDETVRLGFEGYAGDTDTIRLIMATPVHLRIAKKTISEHKMNLGYVVQGCVQRLNALSTTYGNGVCLAVEPYLAEAALANEIQRRLRYVTPRRHSSTQDTGINLGGVLGTLDIADAHHAITDLLYTANMLHIGRHTAEGCGRVITIPANDDAGVAGSDESDASDWSDLSDDLPMGENSGMVEGMR